MSKPISCAKILSATAALLLLSSLATASHADSINAGVFSIDSRPYGIPYNQWLVKWWQWSFSMAKPDHPRDSYTPEKCDNGQTGPVWFLPDSFGPAETRTCTIPEGKAVFVPFQVGDCHNLKSEAPWTFADLRKCAGEGNDPGSRSATLDGRQLKNLDRYHAQADYTNMTIIENNILDTEAGSGYRGSVDGYFIILEPLPGGEHVLNMKVSVIGSAEKKTYGSEKTWRLIVIPSKT